MATGGLPFAVTQHPSNFRDPILTVNDLDRTRGNATANGLRDKQVPIGPGGDLREVSDDEHLMPHCNIRECTSHLSANLSADAVIDLVEDQRRYRVLAREHNLEGEHQARQFAPGGHARERPGLVTDVQLHREGGGLPT